MFKMKTTFRLFSTIFFATLMLMITPAQVQAIAPNSLSGATASTGKTPPLFAKQKVNLNSTAIAWQALGVPQFDGGDFTKVSAIVPIGSDLYVGGTFTNLAGDPNANYIAKWDGTNWSALGTGLNGSIMSMVADGTDLYVGGFFEDAGGVAEADYVAKWDGSNWSALGTGLNDFVYTVALSGSDVYVGGNFSSAGGALHTDKIAKWNGTSWSGLGTVGIHDIVESIAVDGTEIYVGGDFTNAGGVANTKYIAKWNGTTWSALGAGLSSYVYSIATDGTNVYVAGQFSDAGGNPNADSIAKWNGTSWSALGTGFSYGFVGAITPRGPNIYVGGQFENAGSNPNADDIAKYGPIEVTDITVTSNATQDGWLLESSETSGAGGTVNSAATLFYLGDNASKKQYESILSFSTGASLPDTAVITGATLKVKRNAVVGGGNPLSIFQGFMIDINTGYFSTAAALQANDFQAITGKTLGPLIPPLVDNWYSINLSSGFVRINKGNTYSGLTQFRLRFKLDDNNDAIANNISLFSGNAGAANRPQLVISYYVP